MSFKETIAGLVDSGQLDADTQQRSLIDSLANLYIELEAAQNKPPKSWLSRLSVNWLGDSKQLNNEQQKGLYIWGGVGRGKTHLMNLFFEQVPITEKWRIHFHRFMLWVHEQNGKLANQTNPLELIAKQVSDKNKLLCLDEFMVTDIADAMILHGLLKHLYAQGVVLVTTSNTAPNNLYLDGIQRDSFMGAIRLLNQHSHVIEVSGDKDFRTREWVFDEIYYSPLDEKASAGLKRCYHQLTGATELTPKPLPIAGRPIQAVSVADGLAWFEFDELCRTYRSQMDYIQVANQFDTLIVSNIPVLKDDDDPAARRLINLIDTAYDYQVKLLLSAEAPPNALYRGSKLAMPFQRTASRLWEMSTQKYLTAKREVI
ncbi:MAG: cell division protein ZapE [Saprospiraceae bacterium]|jgi:cell division protein ZapE